MKEIVICLGSSCFARGNSKNLEVIQEYLKEHGLEAQVRFRGDLCQEACSVGPVVVLDGQQYTHVAPEKLIALLDRFFEKM